MCNLICHTDRGTQIDGFREQSAEKNICRKQGDSKRRVEKIYNQGSLTSIPRRTLMGRVMESRSVRWADRTERSDIEDNV